jgi:predicted ATPase with chaperone activity
MPKEGSHLDLPIALALLAALNIITNEDSEGALAIGELSLDGRLQPVVGALPAALKAAELGKDLYCPETSGAEAAWVDATRVFATKSLMAIIQHLTGQAPREPAVARQITPQKSMLDMAEVRGQERAKRDGGVRDIHDTIRCRITWIRRHSIYTPLSRTPSHRVIGRNCRREQRRKTGGNFTGA